MHHFQTSCKFVRICNNKKISNIGHYQRCDGNGKLYKYIFLLWCKSASLLADKWIKLVSVQVYSLSVHRATSAHRWRNTHICFTIVFHNYTLLNNQGFNNCWRNRKAEQNTRAWKWGAMVYFCRYQPHGPNDTHSDYHVERNGRISIFQPPPPPGVKRQTQLS